MAASRFVAPILYPIMKLVLVFAALVCAASAWGGFHQGPGYGGLFQYNDCHYPKCFSGGYHGYGCNDGFCEFSCLGGKCRRYGGYGYYGKKRDQKGYYGYNDKGYYGYDNKKDHYTPSDWKHIDKYGYDKDGYTIDGYFKYDKKTTK